MKYPIQVSVMINNSTATLVNVSSPLELSELITKHDWSPSIFSDNRRLVANFLSCDVIGLDVDGGMPLSEALIIFEPYVHIIIPSKSHRLPKNGVVADRYRVVLFLEKQITTTSEFSATWQSLFREFPFIDRAAKDCARMFYKCPHSVVSLKTEGQFVKVAGDAPSRVIATSISSKSLMGKLSYSTYQFMKDGADDGFWNHSLYKAARDYQQNGRSIEDFIQDAENITGQLDSNDLRTIESAFKNEPLYEPRIDFDEGLRKKILSSHLVTNQEDASHNFLVNIDTGETLNIDLKNIKSVLKSDFEYYIKTKRVIASIGYDPHQHKLLFPESSGLYSYNSYRPPFWKKSLFFNGTVAQTATIPEIYKDFLLHLTADDLPSFEYLLDWLALSLQGRNMTILTAIGEEGIGKGILGELMEDLHGAGNFIKVRDNVFKEKFNAPFENRSLVYVDEIKISDRTALDRIKDVVNWQIEIEKKGKDPQSVRNHASFYLSSNSFDAIPIDSGQRRFSIIQLTDTKLSKSDFGMRWETIQKLVDELRDPKNISELASYLYWRHIDQKKMLEPFVSDRALDVKEAGLKDWENWVIYDWCEKRRSSSNIKLSELQNAILEQFKNLKGISRRPIEELSKKFPEVFRVKKVGKSERFIDVAARPNPQPLTSIGLTPAQEAMLDQVDKDICGK